MNNIGSTILEGLNPSNSTLTTIYEVTGSGYALITSIIVACGSSAANATITWNDGSTNFYITNAWPMAVNETKIITFEHGLRLPKTYTLKVQDSVGSRLSFTVNGVFVTERQ